MSTFRQIEVSNKQLNAYGVDIITTAVPYVSGSCAYNLIPTNFRTYTAGAGTATAVDHVFQVTSGTALADYGTIRSFRSVNYKTGQGALIRFGARFVDNLASTWSGVGAFNLGDEYSFGYSGTDFGIWHRYGGEAEIQDLQVTGAAGGSETATVTIDSTAYSVPLTTGTVQHNAYEIEAYLTANGVGFDAEQIDDIVRISFTSDGDKTGTFSFSSSTATGTFSEVNAGATKTSTHVASANWDIPGGIDNFDPSMGNTYQIEYQEGYGDATFYIENPVTGYFMKVHTIQWGNANTALSTHNPSMHIGCYAYSIGATSAVTVQCTSITGFVTGDVRKTRNPRAADNTKSITTALTNLLTIRNSRTYNGHSNQVEIEPLYLTLSNDGGKTAFFELRANPTVGNSTDFQEAGTNIVAQVDTEGTTVSGGRLLAAFVVAKGQSLGISLRDLEIRLPPSIRFVIAAKMDSGAAADLTASITWYEDI